MTNGETNIKPGLKKLAGILFLATSLSGKQAIGADASCVGLREKLVNAAEFAKRHGNWPDDASMYELDASSWTRITRYQPTKDAAVSVPFPISPAPETPECSEGAQTVGVFHCAECVDQVFNVDGDMVAFTIGRAPEACSEPPRIRWRTRDGKSHESALIPLYNFNVAALWCTGRFLILGLEATCEYGSGNLTLAFWDLGTGQIRVYTYGDSHLSIWDYLPDWKQATIISTGGSVVLTSTQSALAFWPEARQWSVMDLRTGRAITDPVKEVAPPKSKAASVEAALRKAIPSALGFTPVKAYEINGMPVVVYRADAARTFSQEQWFERVEGYAVARLKAGELHGALLGVVADKYLLPEPENVLPRGYWKEHLIFSLRGDKAPRVARFHLRND